MKRVFVIGVILLGMCLVSHAKEGLEVSYMEIYRATEEQPVPDTYYWNLRTDGEKSSFVWIQDSIMPNWPERMDGRYEVWKNVLAENELVFKGQVMSGLYYYKETIPTFDWELLPGDTTICEYPCQKARVTFRKKTWNVWYTLDIPYADGPWKLSGLPGLILMAEDTEKNFLYTAYRIKQVPIDKWKLSLGKYLKTTASEYASKKIRAYKDKTRIPIKYHPDGSFSMDSRDEIPDPQTVCLCEYFDDNKK